MVTIFSLVVIFSVGTLIYKKFNPQTTLLLGGLLMMAAAIISNTGNPLPESASSGNAWLDMFTFIKVTTSKTVAGLGLIIMAVGGFAKYMDHIGASRALVNIALKPLGYFKSPYLVMAMGYIIGQLLNIFIPSASGLGLLLMVTLYPILVRLGVSKMSAVAVIATTACLDLGPASGNANLAAKTADLSVTDYFLNYQLPVAIATMITIAVLHFFVQQWFDRRDTDKGPVDIQEEEITVAPPKLYALLPMIPLALIMAFSPMVLEALNIDINVNIDVVTAMFISIAVAMICEGQRHGARNVFKDIFVYFDSMGKQFARVVTLVIAGQVFAHGMKVTGLLDSVIDFAISANISPSLMIIMMVLIITLAAILMGSGNAPFFSFAAMVPDIANKVGINAVAMLMPMQLASGIARSMSPITGAIVAVAGVADVSPFELVKRTAIPMIGALIVSTAASLIVGL
ncbi:C4-dicarboxylate transporter DcuC [Photobacterium aphoticum]|uniref:C4-dicarboxylate ABC transporter n=1 Tax=Photobacterium aphoticum TaxID=754436 RepID=A0A0J1GRI0_9GAMM|nr:C4-dicarboxylate transporter DcuC [Photobacterium aphoticum]KLV02271.1 C4-dicarboxylate ABC transporter [Photobacterium aphoticum]PSU57748.1 C4-dicarboxylate ABC transporter [Photobacterium aphoticum]GHA55103.1 putative cryptic C4-dicarboxylate transporter DcuD [Photobacterium aphoticum]